MTTENHPTDADAQAPILLEDHVVDAVVEHLRAAGWTIVSTAHAHQHGDDVVARLDERVLRVEAKGAGSSKEGTKRFGHHFTANQVGSHVGVAVLRALKWVSLGEAIAALAFPDDAKHRKVVDAIAPALSRAGVGIFWVASDRSVHLEAPWDLGDGVRRSEVSREPSAPSEATALPGEALLETAGLPAAYSILLDAVAAQRPIELNAEGNYVGVRPPGRHIGAFLNKKYVDIAVQPDRSVGVAARFPGATVRPKTTATHYVRVPADADHAPLVEEIVVALDWRDGGHQWNGSTANGSPGADLAGETCATCHYTLSKAGTCYCD